MSANDELIDQYLAGGEKLAMAIRGLTLEDLRCRPAEDGAWQPHQLLVANASDAPAPLA